MRKRFMAAILCLAMLSAFVPAMSVGAATLEGKGTELSPFLISTEDELKLISDFSDACFKLTSDIELSATWSPVLTFSGTLDGNGYTVSGLYMYDKENSWPNEVGFIVENSGTVKNLALRGSVHYESCHPGGAVLVYENSGTIEGCSFIGNAAIVLNNTHSQNSSDFGGLVSINNAEGVIKNCYTRINFSLSYSGGSVSKLYTTAAFVGDNGGLIQNCYSDSSANMTFRGFTHTTSSGGSYVSCYYNKENSNVYQTDVVTDYSPTSTLAMKMEYNYTDWDFDNTWAIDESVNDGYPYLQCERSVVVVVTGFALEETAVSVAEGGTVTLTPVFTPQNASDKTVEWSTSNRYVATVSDGVVTAVAEGTAVITAVANGIEASCTVTVTSAEETPGGTFGDNLTWSYENGTLTIGGSGDMPNVSYESAPWAEYLDKITTVVLGAGITKIPTDAFCDCINLESIVADDANTVFASENGVLFSKDMSVLYAYPQNKADAEYTIPSSVQKIAYGAFYLNYTLEKLYIPDTVTEIESYAICLCGFTIYASTGSAAEEYVTEFNASSSVKLNFVSTSQSANAEYNVETINYESLGNNRYRVWGNFTREKTETDGEVVFIIALYGESGEMIDFIFIETSLEEGQSAKIGGVLKGENATAIKAFVWNSFGEMTSLGNSAEKAL